MVNGFASVFSKFLPKRLALQLLLALSTFTFLHRVFRRPRRHNLIPRTEERVLVIGGTSGIGRSIAHEYAKRGARVCVIGRRSTELEGVRAECVDIYEKNGFSGALQESNKTLLTIQADFSQPEDMVRVRSEIETAWNGLDTILISAGVSALRPLMEVAGVQNRKGSSSFTQASVENIKETVRIADAAQKGNYVGPLVSAVTFIPLLQFTSRSPSILLISSLGAIVAAPTRSLYCSTKSASLVLYQSLAVEHPGIKFSFMIPSTVEGDFRASAVDGGEVREVNPNKHGLKREVVAKRCVKAVDSGEKVVMMPLLFSRGAHYGYWMFPGVIERLAAKKYDFTPQ